MEALRRTWMRRPDLLEKASLSNEDRELLKEIVEQGPGEKIGDGV